MSLIMLTDEEAEEYRRKEAEEFRQKFLAEVERRAGASRSEMLGHCRDSDPAIWQHHDPDCDFYMSEGVPPCNCSLMEVRWLRRILGEKEERS